MTSHPELSPDLLAYIETHGLDPSRVKEQLQRFHEGFPDLEIVRPATIGDGIIRTTEEEEKHLIGRFEQAQHEGRIMKFVPASGAASRMFKTLQNMLHSDHKLKKEYFDEHPDDEEVRFTRTCLDHLESFAFYEDLCNVMARDDLNPVTLRNEGDFRTIISYLLEEHGLGLASLPKALIPFHRYKDHCRAPLEEHLVEGRTYTQNANGKVRIHFTISQEHEEAFQKRLAMVRGPFESGNTHYEVETSFQKPETDTIAVDTDNRPFFDDEGKPVFRPGGHGALLANLQDLKGDIVFIKNIDNVVPDHLKDPTYRYKKIIGGYLLMLQDHIFTYLKELDRGNNTRPFLDDVGRFVKNELYLDVPEFTGPERDQRLSRWLFDRLNRPIRVCGIVKNEGEPGGGPFIVKNRDGSTSIQIVEDAQINLEKPDQRRAFKSATHFNPTDLVCSLRDYQGKTFDLEPFRDPDTGFISKKSYEGRELKALELPGLWNGSMAYWNSVFVEVPQETFNPVKTVNDLLRAEHRLNPTHS